MSFAIPLFIIVCILAWILRPGKSPSNVCKLSILSSAFFQFDVAVVAVVLQLLHNSAGNTGVSDISNICFIVGLCLIGVAILASAALFISHRREIARCTGFGVCIAVVIAIINFALLEWLGGL